MVHMHLMNLMTNDAIYLFLESYPSPWYGTSQPHIPPHPWVFDSFKGRCREWRESNSRHSQTGLERAGVQLIPTNIIYLHSLKLTQHLKMDGWKTCFLLGRYIFRCELLVSGRVFNYALLQKNCFFYWRVVSKKTHLGSFRTYVQLEIYMMTKGGLRYVINTFPVAFRSSNQLRSTCWKVQSLVLDFKGSSLAKIWLGFSRFCFFLGGEGLEGF